MTDIGGASGSAWSLTELLQAEQDGLYTELELLARIFSHLTRDNVCDVIAALPPDLRISFVEWARERYDNNVDPSEFFHIGGEGGDSPPREAFVAIRFWLAQKRPD